MKSEEPFFIVNDYVEENRKQLESILEIVESNKGKEQDKAVFIRNFTNELFKAYHKNKSFINQTKEKEKTIQERQELEKRKLELLKKLKLAELEKKIKAQTQEDKQDLIISRFTNKPLVTAIFDGFKYILIEPKITEAYKKILDNIQIKDVKDLYNVELFKNLVQEQCKKQNIEYSDDLMDAIRYTQIKEIDNYGTISAVLEDDRVKEIICDGKEKPLHITFKDKTDVVTNIIYKTNEELNKVIKKVAQKSGITLSIENPFITVEKEGWTFQGNLKTEFIEPKFIFARK